MYLQRQEIPVSDRHTGNRATIPGADACGARGQAHVVDVTVTGP